jgi:hypothetical protein
MMKTSRVSASVPVLICLLFAFGVLGTSCTLNGSGDPKSQERQDVEDLITAECNNRMASETALPADPATILEVPTDYATIQEAVDAAGDGDTVYLRNGYYTETVSMTGLGKVHLLGESRSNVIIDGTGFDEGVVWGSGGSVKNLTVTGSSIGIRIRDFAKIFNVNVYGSSEGLHLGFLFNRDQFPAGEQYATEVLCSKLNANGDSGVSFANSFSMLPIRVAYSKIQNNGFTGVRSNGGVLYFDHNLITGNTNFGMWLFVSMFGPELMYTTAYIDHNVFEDQSEGIALTKFGQTIIKYNSLNNHELYPISYYGFEPWDRREQTQISIISNKIRQAAQKGIWVTWGWNMRIENNLIEDASIAGMEIEGMNVSVHNNTILANRYGLYLHTDGRAFMADKTNIRVFNNIFKGGSDAAMALECNNDINFTCADFPLDVRANTVWNAAVTTIGFPFPTNSVSANTLANPLFTNAASGDYSLTAGSPSVDTGVTYSPMDALDADGTSRIKGAWIDRGAFERGTARTRSTDLTQ